MFNLKMANVGHGLSLNVESHDNNIHVDYGAQNNFRKKAFCHLIYNNPKSFFLFHFHYDHYNGLERNLNVGAKLNIEKLYFPRIPNRVEKRYKFLKCLLAMNMYLLGGMILEAWNGI